MNFLVIETIMSPIDSRLMKSLTIRVVIFLQILRLKSIVDFSTSFYLLEFLVIEK